MMIILIDWSVCPNSKPFILFEDGVSVGDDFAVIEDKTVTIVVVVRYIDIGCGCYGHGCLVEGGSLRILKTDVHVFAYCGTQGNPTISCCIESAGTFYSRSICRATVWTNSTGLAPRSLQNKGKTCFNSIIIITMQSIPL